MGEWLLSPTGKYSDSASGCLAGWLKAGNGKLDGLMERKEISFFFFALLPSPKELCFVQRLL